MIRLTKTRVMTAADVGAVVIGGGAWGALREIVHRHRCGAGGHRRARRSGKSVVATGRVEPISKVEIKSS